MSRQREAAMAALENARKMFDGMAESLDFLSKRADVGRIEVETAMRLIDGPKPAPGKGGGDAA